MKKDMMTKEEKQITAMKGASDRFENKGNCMGAGAEKNQEQMLHCSMCVRCHDVSGERQGGGEPLQSLKGKGVRA